MRKLLALLLLVPMVAAVTVVEDPSGDVIVGSYGQKVASPYPWQAVDFVEISVEEDLDNFYWTVTIAGEATALPGSCPDTGDLRTFFRYGEARYHVQQGVDLNCNPYGMFWESYNGDFQRRFISALEVSVEGPAITVTIPKELVLDEGGAPPIEGRMLTHIRGRSFNMASLGGPDITDPFNGQEADVLVVNDDIPDDAANAGSYEIQSGGITYEGDIRLWSERPFRASNGGDGVFLYDLKLQNRGAAGEYTLQLGPLPDQWRVAGPTEFSLLADSITEFQLAIEVPFRHIHGGTDAVSVRVENEASWAEMEIGISYLTVPQPAGHHQEVYFYRTGFNGIAPFGGGGTFTMNTTAHTGSQAANAELVEGPAGTTLRWHACYEGDLKLGLNFTEEQGTFAAMINSQTPLDGTFSGSIVHLGPGAGIQVCHPSFFGDRTQTEIATIDETAVAASGTVSVSSTITPLVDLVPYQSGSTLYVQLSYDHSLPNVATLFQTSMTEGVELVLPLAEYREGNVIGAIGEEEAADLSDVEPETEEEAQETPWVFPLLGLAVLGRFRK